MPTTYYKDKLLSGIKANEEVIKNGKAQRPDSNRANIKAYNYILKRMGNRDTITLPETIFDILRDQRN
jgi:hypothetical protein